jgi:hypothetical protein
MFSNAQFLTSRPLFNDYVTRWVVIAIVGLVSGIGLWELNVTIVGSLFGWHLSVTYYLLYLL